VNDVGGKLNASQATAQSEEDDMRTTDQTSPKLRIRREALRQLTSADLRVVAAGTSQRNPHTGMVA
jgi:hypothetical protein